MNKKYILVTGANKGIGFEVCKQLQELGFSVILTARNANSGKKSASQINADFLQIDVSDIESIKSAFRILNDRNIKISSLINNAGVYGGGMGSSLFEDTIETNQSVFGINTFGPLYMSKIFTPILTEDASIVMVSSGAGETCQGVQSSYGTYGASKAMLNVVTRFLAEDLRNQKISVNAVCPGWVKTDMGGPSAPRSVSKGAETIVWLAQNLNNDTGKFYRDKREISW